VDPAPEDPHAVPETRWPSAEEARRSLWFSPIAVGPCALEQRTWVPAMVPWRATEDGIVTRDVIDWYARFAAGRPGAIVVEATGIRDVPSGPLLRAGDDRFVPGLRRLAEAVRAASGGHTRLFIQLIDFLAVKRRPPEDKFFARFLIVGEEHRGAWPRRPGTAWMTAPEAELRAALRAAGPICGDMS
jgi:2,4-dienoyl-CoA reductase-like NADH-dependent reductase (Old Yellow Enzyme family)